MYVDLVSSDDEDMKGEKRDMPQPLPKKKIKTVFFPPNESIDLTLRDGETDLSSVVSQKDLEIAKILELQMMKTNASDKLEIPEIKPVDIESAKTNASMDKSGSSKEKCNFTDAAMAEPSAVAPASVQSTNNVHFNEFLNACKEADSSPDMNKIIQKMLKYFKDAAKNFTNSDFFAETIREMTKKVNKKPISVYLCMETVKEELKKFRHSDDVAKEKNSKTDQLEQILGKLYAALAECEKNIQILEKQEVNFDDDNESCHIMAGKFKSKAVEIYKKICKLTGTSSATQVGVKFHETEYREFNKAIQEICKTEFPDFNDVKQLLKRCNDKFHYGLTPMEVDSTAQSAFETLGAKLQKRRMEDLYLTAEKYSNGRDPALDDPVLRAKLDAHKKQFQQKLNEILQDAVEEEKRQKQNQIVPTSKSKTEDKNPNVLDSNKAETM